MKRPITFVLMATMLAGLTSCGSSKAVNLSGGPPASNATGASATSPASGNWLWIAISQVPDIPPRTRLQAYLRGALQSGATGTAEMRTSTGCLLTFKTSPLGDPVAFSSSITGSSVVFESASVNGGVTTITTTINNGTNMGGTYLSVGGPVSSVFHDTFCNGDQGSIYGTQVPDVSGNWTGALANWAPDPVTANVGPTGDLVNVTLSLQQASTPNLDGSFSLSGNLAIDGLPCYSSGGSLDSTRSFIQGDLVTITFVTAGSTIQLMGSLANPAVATQMGAPLGNGSLGLMSLTTTACTALQATGFGTLNKS